MSFLGAHKKHPSSLNFCAHTTSLYVALEHFALTHSNTYGIVLSLSVQEVVGVMRLPSVITRRPGGQWCCRGLMQLGRRWSG